MKKILLTIIIAVIAVANMLAQQISVVSPDGSTTLHRTLAEAIAAIDDGYVIYLPGGGFTIADSVKITKQVTIMGLGHKTVTDNVEGSTTISGNLFFNVGSSKSAIIGCYITGNVVIGEDGVVNDVLVRYCNLNSVQVKNSECQETFVNQNYIRSASNFGSSNAEITNNIMHSLGDVHNGTITNNVILSQYCYRDVYNGGGYSSYYAAVKADLSKIMYNVIILADRSDNYHSNYYNALTGSENTIIKNMMINHYGEDYINPSDADWNNVFKNYNNGAINTNSDFHFNENYKEYESQVGIYAGTGFKDSQKAPTPYIIEKYVDEQTDAQGKLKIRISVKAGE